MYTNLFFTHFYSTHFTIHLITYFYAWWTWLHPYLVSVIPFHIIRLCQYISSVHLSSLVFPIHIAHHPFASLFWTLFPIFTPLFSLSYSSSVLISCWALSYCSWSLIVPLPISCSYGHCWC